MENVIAGIKFRNIDNNVTIDQKTITAYAASKSKRKVGRISYAQRAVIQHYRKPKWMLWLSL